MKLKHICLVVMVFLTTMVFGQQRVCFGVYLNESFAWDFVEALEKEEIATAIVEIERYPGSVYLYVVSEKEFATVAQAEAYKEQLQEKTTASLFENKTLSVRAFENPRFLQRSASSLPVSSPSPEQKTPAATKNDLPLTEEIPYSVLLNRYREELQAQRSKEQLQRKEIDSYIVKKYNDESLLSFDLHSGAFATEEEARDYQERLKERGVVSQEVQHLNEFQEETQEFDQLTQEKKVVAHQKDYQLPEEIPSLIVEQLSYLPIHSDYSLSELRIIDLSNIKKVSYQEKIFADFNIENISTMNENVEALSVAIYENLLFDKKIVVNILSVKEKLEVADLEEGKSIRYNSKEGDLVFYLQDDFSMVGYSKDARHAIILVAEEFTDEEWKDFISRSWLEEDPLLFPEIRHSLFILPKTNDDNRLFLGFELSRVGETYAQERGDVLWARQMVGHWNANYYFDNQGSYGYIGFFNMDYDLNASETHKLFMEIHGLYRSLSRWNISEEKRVGRVKGWYLEKTAEEKELSFSYKPYIIAVGSTFTDKGMLSFDKILDFSLDLQIWEDEDENQ